MALTQVQSGMIGGNNPAVPTSTAVGTLALNSNSGANNTAVGYQAGYSNTTGTLNTAAGKAALYSNTTGSQNSSFGYETLFANTTGGNNTAFGQQALTSNTTASNNTAVGYQAGYSNQTGNYNAFFGYQAGYTSNGTGTPTTYNTFLGAFAGYSATTGTSNTFIGNNSGISMTTGSKNTILGSYGGNQGGLDIRTASNWCVISDGDGNPNMFMKNGVGLYIYGAIASGAGTNTMKYNTSTGFVSYDTSSARYKDNIRDSVYGLDAVMQLRSTQFEYKDDGRSDVGLIAEEVQPIIPELVGVNKEGQADSVSYDRMVSVLVKAIQELKAEVDSLKQQINNGV